jgi:hypothetical protein
MHGLLILMAMWFAGGAHAATADPPSIGGAWTLNNELSDAPTDPANRGADDSNGRQGESGHGRGGGGHHGGGGAFGGGFGGRGAGRGGYGGSSAETREATARMRDAMRDIMEASEHLTITQTPTTIVITGADGRTTRLAPDGKKVKDENTNIERRTKWEGDRLVSEIGGLAPGKATQTFVVEPDSHRLRVSVQLEGGRSGQPRTVTHVYDPDPR